MKRAPDFEPPAIARKLLREARAGALSTLTPAADPYGSLVNVATTMDGAPLLLLSRLALHTKNILADPRASLLLHENNEGDPPQGVRITLTGKAIAIDDANARRRYLLRHPEAATFVDFPDFGFYRIDVVGGHLIAGFGRVVDLPPDDILTDLSGADDLIAAEPEIVAHLNAAHKDTVALFATRLLDAPAGDWICVGCDPQGLDLQKGRVGLRLAFPRRVTAAAPLRQMLKILSDRARA